MRTGIALWTHLWQNAVDCDEALVVADAQEDQGFDRIAETLGEESNDDEGEGDGNGDGDGGDENGEGDGDGGTNHDLPTHGTDFLGYGSSDGATDLGILANQDGSGKPSGKGDGPLGDEGDGMGVDITYDLWSESQTYPFDKTCLEL